MMKMSFETPEMKIARFRCENIVTTSGVTAESMANTKLTEKQTELGISSDQVKAILTF